MDKSLTKDVQELDNLEAIIAEGLQTFVEVGSALSIIRDRELYRLRGYDTFALYCSEVWNLNQNQVAARIEANDAVAFLLESGIPAPTKQSHALVLARIDEPALRAIAWQEAVNLYGDSITAEKLASVVSKYLLMNKFPVFGELVKSQKLTATQVNELAAQIAGAGRLAAPILEHGITMDEIIAAEAIKHLVRACVLNPAIVEDVEQGVIYIGDDVIPLAHVKEADAIRLYKEAYRESTKTLQDTARSKQTEGKAIFTGAQIYDMAPPDGDWLAVILPAGVSPSTVGNHLASLGLEAYAIVAYKGNPRIPFAQDKVVGIKTTDVLPDWIMGLL